MITDMIWVPVAVILALAGVAIFVTARTVQLAWKRFNSFRGH